MTQEYPDALYSYQTFNVNTLMCLIRGAIKFSDPATFNDPFDCRCILQNDLEEGGIQRLCRDWINKSYKNRPDMIDEQFMALDDPFHYGLAEDGRCDPPERHRRWIERGLKSLLGRRGVACFASKMNNPLMWSHYADKHQGFCLKFDYKQAVNLGIQSDIRKVTYKNQKTVLASDVRRFLNRQDEDAKRQIENAFFYTKSPSWHYEKEWRMTERKAGFFSPPADLSAIYFGYKCPTEVKIAIVLIFRQVPETDRPLFFEMGSNMRAARLPRHFDTQVEIGRIRKQSQALKDMDELLDGVDDDFSDE